MYINRYIQFGSILNTYNVKKGTHVWFISKLTFQIKNDQINPKGLMIKGRDRLFLSTCVEQLSKKRR